MTVISYNFRKTYQTKKKFTIVDFWLKNNPIFGIIQIFVKNKNVIRTNSLMPVIRNKFRKTYGADLEKSSNMLILGPKMTHSQLEHNVNFTKRSRTSTINPVIT